MSASALVMLEGVEGCSVHGKTFPLVFGRSLTFGRAINSDCLLPHAAVPRELFEAAWRGCGFWVRLLHDRHTMLLNARSIPHGVWTRICTGDLLNVSEPRLRVVMVPQMASVAVRQIAQSIRKSRDYTAMPVLADALEEEGFTVSEVLQHCRDAGGHDESCWVLDLFLGRQQGGS